MSDAPTGIFNPFAPKKKKKSNIKKLDERRTESGTLVEPAVTFDGDRYILKFQGITDIPEAVDRLSKLLYDVNKAHESLMLANGITISPANTGKPAEDEMTLHGPTCDVTVYVGDPPHEDEVPVYRRIAYTLYKLPIGPLLKKYRATVSERG
jgi:hypothetical protein